LFSVDLGTADRKLESEVGQCLYTLFTDDNSLDAAFWAGGVNPAELRSSVRYNWLYEDDWFEMILTWFKNTAVISGISDADALRWISDITSESEPEKNLLEPLAKRMAIHAFQEPTDATLAYEAFLFLIAFRSKVCYLFLNA
jgi:hypothetical protein